MKTVETFLAEVAHSRLETQFEERKGFRAPSAFELPSALEVALRHRWLVAPVLARSPLAVNSASCGVPSSDRQQIAYWLARYPEANWSLVTGPQSRVMGLEIEMTLAGSWLAELLEDDWTRTLRFTCGSKCFMLLASDAGLPSLAVYPGLRLHPRQDPDSTITPSQRRPTRVRGLACAAAVLPTGSVAASSSNPQRKIR